MGVLAVYDVEGIQDFVFASTKLKENIGASRLVANVLECYLPEVIESVCNNGGENYAITNWKDQSEFCMLQQANGKLQAEVIYIGGGNALVAYDNQEVFNSVNKRLAVVVLERTRSLGIAVAGITTDFGDNYQAERKLLFEKRLRNSKQQQMRTQAVSALPITRRQAASGQPIVEIDRLGNDFIELDAEQSCKNREYNMAAKLEESNCRCKEAAQFEDIATQKGEDSNIAVVHIDGNNMGEQIIRALKDFQSYKEAVPHTRALSKGISFVYSEALQCTLEKLQTDYLEGKILTNMQRKTDTTKLDTPRTILPWRQLIGEGDDITLVMNGRIAISFAAHLLSEIEKREIKGIGTPSACAGVAIIKHNFPFYAAYRFAESCCGSAKKRARKMMKDGKMQSWIDFHSHKTHSMEDIDALRRQYFKQDENGILQLLLRPLCVTPNSNPIYDYAWFSSAICTIKSKANLRSHLKKLQDAFLQGRKETNERWNHMMWRGKDLHIPEFPSHFSFTKDQLFFTINNDETGEITTWLTPYFDLLDLMDDFDSWPLAEEDTRNEEVKP